MTEPIYIHAPVIELLAIKLYEHSHPLGWYPYNAGGIRSWLHLTEEEREVWRRMARGGDSLPTPEAEKS